MFTAEGSTVDESRVVIDPAQALGELVVGDHVEPDTHAVAKDAMSGYRRLLPLPPMCSSSPSGSAPRLVWIPPAPVG
jgi:hypothetical protein